VLQGHAANPLVGLDGHPSPPRIMKKVLFSQRDKV
jgi:hypothetical protein